MKRSLATVGYFGAALAVSTLVIAATTTRVSVDSSAAQSNNDSFDPSISADGRYVAFGSHADNLVAGDTNGRQDVFVHDRVTGATTRVSVSSGGAQASNTSDVPSISGDGRFVAFASDSDDLVSGDTNLVRDIFVHDRVTGVTERVSVSTAGVQGNAMCDFTAISGDGRWVVFESDASNLVAGDTNGFTDIFVRDRLTGQTFPVSSDPGNFQGNGRSYRPSNVSNLPSVAFTSDASNLVAGDTNGFADIFVSGENIELELVSVSSSGVQGNGDCDERSAISTDGRFVAFSSAADNLVSGDGNGVNDIFVRDLLTEVTTRVSVDSSGIEANGQSLAPYVSADGRFVSFTSFASNLISGDTNNKADVFVHDRVMHTTIRVSESSAGGQGDGDSFLSPISADGTIVAFDSAATNLVAGDTNGFFDIFVNVRTVPEVVLPDSFSLFRGILTGGGLSDLFASDDSWMTVLPGITLNQAERQVQLVIVGTSPTETPTELRFRLEAHAEINNIGQWIELWNYDTNSYEQVDFMIATLADSIVEVSITTNPERFIEAGTKEMRAKVSYKEAGIVLSFPWLISFDQTVWVIVR